MRRLFFGQWFTAGRVLLVGLLAGLIFSTSENRFTFLTAAQAITSLVALTAGVKLGFLFNSKPTVLRRLSKIGGEHYALAGAAGFVLAALWGAENGNAWPLAIWFLPAGFLEAVSSSITLARIQSAS
jgi:hypothetical protein